MDARNSFIFYVDWFEEIADLTRSQKGELLEMMATYVRDGSVPETKDKIVNHVFKKVQRRLDIDAEKYQRQCEITRKKTMWGGIKSRLSEGRTLSQESLQFMYDDGRLSRPYLRKQGIEEEIINSVFKSAESFGIISTAEFEEGKSIPPRAPIKRPGNNSFMSFEQKHEPIDEDAIIDNA